MKANHLRFIILTILFICTCFTLLAKFGNKRPKNFYFQIPQIYYSLNSKFDGEKWDYKHLKIFKKVKILKKVSIEMGNTIKKIIFIELLENIKGL